jgi:hypothetical protein
MLGPWSHLVRFALILTEHWVESRVHNHLGQGGPDDQ